MKGFSFKQLDELYKRLGLHAPKRRVIIKPPANVWRLLRLIAESGIWVEDRDVLWWLLELLKAMYGLNDAPFAFQACEGEFYCEVLEAIRSKFDENFYFWLLGPGRVRGLASAHVDDNEMATPKDGEGRRRTAKDDDEGQRDQIGADQTRPE